MAAQGKRVSVPPRRFTYQTLGQPTDENPTSSRNFNMGARLPGTSSQVNQERTNLLTAIAEAQHEKEVGERVKAEALSILKKFEGKQEDELSVEELAAWRKAKADSNNGGILVKLKNEELARLQSSLKQFDAPTMPLRKTKSIGGSSCLSTHRVKQLELQTRKKALKLEADFAQSKRELRRKLHDVEELIKRAQDPDEIQKLQDEIASYKAIIQQQQMDYDEDMSLLKKEEELELLQIEVDEEDDQFLESDDEHGVQKDNGISKWPPQTSWDFRHPVSEYDEAIDAPPPPPPSNNVVADLTSALKNAFREVREDKLWEPRDLPTFNGKAEDWPIFVNEFRRTTPEGKTNSSQNAIRLRKALKGSAKEAVIGLLNEPENVEKILDTLEQRFGRKELIIQALIEKAEQCKSPDPLKPESFVAFGTTVQHLIQTVKSLHETRYLQDIGLLNKLVSKLPVLYAREWLQWLHSDPERNEDLLNFMDWLEINMNLNIRLYKPVVKDESLTGRNNRGSRGSVRVNVIASEDTEKTEEIPKEKCLFCDMTNHKTQQCYRFKRKTPEERVKFVKEKVLCFRCLSSGHIKKDCRSKMTCDKDNCQRDHHPLLHLDGKPWKAREKSLPNESQEVPPEDERNMKPFLSAGGSPTSIGVVQTQQSKPMSIVMVRIKGPKGIRRVHAMLDSGANTTMVDNRLAEELGIVGGKVVTNKCHVFGGLVTTSLSKDVGFKIEGNYKGAKMYPVKGALTFKDMNLLPYSQDASLAKQKWKYLKRAKLDTFVAVTPKILIGEDQAFLTAHRELLQGDFDQPIAKRTLLGWVLGGQQLQSNGHTNVNVLSAGETDYLDSIMKSHFSLESYGIFPKTSIGSVEDQRSLTILESTSRKIGKQWEVGLLWRKENVKLPESYQQAESRLISNERRMWKNQEYFNMYHSKIDDYFAKGYIRELSQEEAKVTTDSTFYIPHFGVLNVNKPGKLRIVFDAACKNGGISLNEYLMTGPDLIRPLPTVLINFRKWNIVINGDIEDMFHRVAVRRNDQDSQRFLWRDLREKMEHRTIKTLVMTVLIFGACSSPAEAIYIKDKNADEFKEEKPEAVRSINEDFYSDDCLSGAQTEDEAIKLRKDITAICAAGNFGIKKWLSNSTKVIASIPVEDRAAGLKGFGGKEEIPLERVLGLWWDPTADEFTFSANFKKVDPKILRGDRPTKREMCRLLMSVFDPLGFIANFKIKGLILLQRTWRTEVGWDDTITDSILEDWRKWVADLKNTENVRVSRAYIRDIHLATNIQLHTLVDASEEATSAVTYLRVKHGDAVTVSFVFGKAKVAPNKKQTIPRLELIAAVMGACQADTITKDLRVDINSRYFWTDSRLVLLWIRTETRRHKEFVANRVNRIQLLSSAKEWNWVPTALNVADQGTRLKSKVELTRDLLWLKGPAFLMEEQEAWPVEDLSNEVVEDANEVRRSVVTSVGASGSLFQPDVIINIDKFSDYVRMVKAQAAVIRAARHWIQKVKKEVSSPPWKMEVSTQSKNKSRGFLAKHLQSYTTPEDFRAAEEMIIKAVQLSAFKPEIVAIMEQRDLPRNSKILKLQPFLENGILRIKGRIEAASVANETKNPILLPTYHPFTELRILKEHERLAHQGHATVLCELRKRFWIIHARAAIRYSLARCQPCKLSKAKPIIPSMGSLPYYRLVIGKPAFTYTGVDLMGPIEVVVGRHHEKRWVAIFTCMVTRAVHIEVVHGLTTDETMMALSRFISSRGRPHHIFSDNGTNFVGAKREIQENWYTVDWNSIMNLDKFREIKWDFTPPHAPHFGGAWERMVQSVKKILKKTLRETFPKDQILITLLKEAENMINSRPLTYASEDPSDQEPLTPNHFLRGHADVGSNIPGDYRQDNESVRAHWRRAQYFMEQFWKRWTEEALPELIKRSKWYQDTAPLESGELVLMVDDQGPRNSWKRRVITKTFPGGDGQVRVVLVEAVDRSTGRKSTYKRAVEKVIPLGLRMKNQATP